MKSERSCRHHRVPCLLAIALTLLVVVPTMAAEFPPKTLENLKVLPKDTEVSNLLAMMREFSMGLGVRCLYCHVGEEGTPLTEVDFKSDDKEEKQEARVMMRMTQAINRDHLPKLGGDAASRVTVQCVTCHRGQTSPAQLGDVLLAELGSGGIDDAVAKYKELREKFYGSQSFDFSEGTLPALGETLLRDGRVKECEAMLRLNLEFFPESTRSWTFLAELYRRQARFDEAREAVAQALAIDSGDRRAQQILAQIDKADQADKESQE